MEAYSRPWVEDDVGDEFGGGHGHVHPTTPGSEDGRQRQRQRQRKRQSSSASGFDMSRHPRVVSSSTTTASNGIGEEDADGQAEEGGDEDGYANWIDEDPGPGPGTTTIVRINGHQDKGAGEGEGEGAGTKDGALEARTAMAATNNGNDDHQQ